MKCEAKQLDMPSLEQLEAEAARCRYKSRFTSTLLSTAAILIVVASLSAMVTLLWVPVYRVYGSSMAPTLKNGQIVLAVKSGSFNHGDLVAFYYGNKLLIKRVIAGPGDMVDIRENGDVYVNDVLLDEPYVSEKSLGNSNIVFPLRVTEEHWFLLGDNRTVSIDSRDAQLGCVSQEQIAGRIILRVWPLDTIQKFGDRNQ